MFPLQSLLFVLKCNICSEWFLVLFHITRPLLWASLRTKYVSGDPIPSSSTLNLRTQFSVLFTFQVILSQQLLFIKIWSILSTTLPLPPTFRSPLSHQKTVTLGRTCAMRWKPFQVTRRYSSWLTALFLFCVWMITRLTAWQMWQERFYMVMEKIGEEYQVYNF